jgi:hypothetical protein
MTGPNPVAASTGASFTFAGSDAHGVAGYECALDSAAFTACTSPRDLSWLSDGEHTFQVRAIDTAGNVDPTPASHTWVVDTIAPDTAINAAPPSMSNESAPSVTFSGSDANGVARFECALDGAPFSPCTSPASLSNLAEGVHTIQVRAIDNAGRVDAAPATHTWTVDVTPPDTTIDSSPAALSTNSAPEFLFSGSDANDITGYQCKLDTAEFSARTSPLALSGLSDGAHTFQVRAIDTAGNLDPSPASYTWIVDTTAPVSGPTVSGNKTGDWYIDMATVTVTATDINGVDSIKYNLDDGAWLTYTAPVIVTGNGAHTIAYYAVDAAGNTESVRTVGTLRTRRFPASSLSP